MKTVTHPYVAIRCPITLKSFVVKEGEAVLDEDGNVTRPAMWLYAGHEFNNLDDILKFRENNFKKKITVSRAPKKKSGGPRRKRQHKR